ncbi:hypothetical protein [Polyangium aurulentum]|uniref:hypothetical protein n=1 Tax=Polyangium aurulentum TaxID=2567896 RepID=UPI0010AEB600|nr:hypothetical protein [Polyangium aurulentum]UQA57565.1 hypothetical protein E8A73_040835 [Polyangium aurulentum]
MSPTSSVFASSLAALAVGGGLLLWPSASQAQTTSAPLETAHGGSVGVLLSFSVGARPAFGIGIDLRYTHYVELPYRSSLAASNENYYGLGAFFQASYLRGGAGRFAVGGHGGFYDEKIYSLDGELGFTYRTASIDGKEPGGPALHLGFTPIFSLFLLEHGPSFRGAIGLAKDTKSEFIIGHDFRAPTTCMIMGCSLFGSGRPLRAEAEAEPVRARVRFAPGAPRRRAPQTPMDETTRARLFAHWARETSAECASVPAFLALARDLARAGAPRALVTQALRAAREEAAHTALCTEIASDHAPAPILADTPAVPPSSDTDEASLLKRLALDSFWDGCVAEGGAAAQARRMRHFAGDARVCEALSVIARDEQGHADLSERILAFCLARGGKPVRDALAESVETRRAGEEERMLLGDEEVANDVDIDLARAHGLPDADVARQARVEAWERSLRLHLG